MVFTLRKFLGTEEEVPAAGPAAPPGKAPDRKSIFRNRFNYGVNFGSLFLLEKFIFHQFFIDNTGTELDAITCCINRYGIDKTRQDLENHWNAYVNDNDWNWLKSKGVTTIRLPIGYWHVNGGYFTPNTPFFQVSRVYSNAWLILKNIIQKANQYDIGILIDLHALPGGANNAEHSGLRLSKPEFWGNDKYLDLTIAILEFIIKDLGQFENLAGLQIVNESCFDNEALYQKQYYSKAIRHIRKIDSNIPIIISDGWWTDQWVKWVNEKESKLNNESIGVVIDDHVYRCFSDSDRNKSPEQIINDLNGDLLTNLSGNADIMVGEYSHVLDTKSWEKTQNDRNQLVHSYGQALFNLITTRANYGFFFWTFKFQEGDGGEWGFQKQVDIGNIPILRTVNKIPSLTDFQNSCEFEFNNHSNYWNSQNQNEHYEHWRFKEGFITGWSDAVEFLKLNSSKIGRINSWISSRRIEHIKFRNNSRFIWEWDHGFHKGIEKALEFVYN